MVYTTSLQIFSLSLSLITAIVCLGFVSSGAGADAGQAPPELKVVEHVDLNRYMGRWYEVASIPVFFQKACAGGTTATYTLGSDGKVAVLNQCCTSEGGTKVAKGRAWVVDAKTNAKLKVSFVSVLGLWLFSGDYWIIDLGPDYEYAVVGHPDRNIGWILSRTPTLPDTVMKRIAERLKANGYDFSRFRMTNQTDFRCGTD